MSSDRPTPANHNPARIRAAEFAALFSEPGESEQQPAVRTKRGLMHAAAALITDSLWTLRAASGRRNRPQAFARRAI